MAQTPSSLFARTAWSILLALSLFMVFTGFVMFNYILKPLGQQGAGDLAALMVLSAKTWVELPPEARPDFQVELREYHDLILQNHPPTGGLLQPLRIHSPYMRFLEQALSARMGQAIHVQRLASQPDWYWVMLPVAGQHLYLGVQHTHIGAKPPRAVIFIFLGAALFVLLTTLWLVRRTTRPLERLSAAVMRLGQGGHEVLPETGPRELAQLAARFNQLSRQIEQLLENRTTLLGGISHDLRTPLARLMLGLELLKGENDADLLAQMKADLEEMDGIIQRSLELARMMQMPQDLPETLELREFLQALTQPYLEQGHDLRLHLPDTACFVNASGLVLRRVLNNLLDNALSYATAEGLELHLSCRPDKACIQVLDRGPGIPETHMEKVFQPFYRLEPSRSRTTGGSGLGLAIVRQLAQLQGWRVRLENRARGGLRAVVEVPRQV